MTQDQHRNIEAFARSHMTDSAHDPSHMDRVLYSALMLARAEPDGSVDMDVLIAACLLHDIGRAAQYRDRSICHAQEGAQMARAHLLGEGWAPSRAGHAADCIRTHRFRRESPPSSIEAKILFDADKLDACGALGIARTLIYGGILGQPLYTLSELDGGFEGQPGEDTQSFAQEYLYKLRNIGDNFFTPTARQIARSRKEAAEHFFRNLVGEVSMPYHEGGRLLGEILEN